MPIYEYRCAACGLDFERLVRGLEEQVACPECRSTKVRRQLSVVASPRVGGSSSQRGDDAGGGCCGGACCQN